MKVYIYKSGNRWLMDTTTKVGSREIPITVEPDSSHLSLWFELHLEDDETSSVYHDIHCTKCVICRECMDCNLRPCPVDGGVHTAGAKGFVHHYKEHTNG